MLNIAFCDDDINFLNAIIPKVKKIFESLKMNVSIHAFPNGNELIAAFGKYDLYFDIVFLDIEMPKISGKKVAEELRRIDRRFKLVFITAFPQEAINTFQYDVIGFLPKNNIFEHLEKTLKLVIEKIDEENPKPQLFRVHGDNNIITEIKIPLNEILYFDCVNREVYLHTLHKQYLLNRIQFSDVKDKYTKLGFVDIYRTCIVNVKYICAINDIEIELSNREKLPLSRRKKAQIYDVFSNLVNKEEL